MILKARHHFLIYPFFKWYSQWIINKTFHRVIVKGDFKDRNLPILLIANHLGWWDGFWVMMLNEKLLKRKFHFMMLEEQLSKHRILNYTGGFSVNKNSRSIIESLDYCTRLLRNSENMVLVFPQGEIESQHKHQFRFEKGIERVLKNLGNQPIQILFVSNLVDYFSYRKPTLAMNLKEAVLTDYSSGEIENEFNKFHAECIENQLKMENR